MAVACNQSCDADLSVVIPEGEPMAFCEQLGALRESVHICTNLNQRLDSVQTALPTV